MMDVPEFEDLLGRIGDDLTQWPAARQQDAAALLRESEPARAALAEARQLRIALRADPVRAPAGLLDRIMQKARQSTPVQDGDQPDGDPQRRPREGGKP